MSDERRSLLQTYQSLKRVASTLSEHTKQTYNVDLGCEQGNPDYLKGFRDGLHLAETLVLGEMKGITSELYFLKEE